MGDLVSGSDWRRESKIEIIEEGQWAIARSSFDNKKVWYIGLKVWRSWVRLHDPEEESVGI